MQREKWLPFLEILLAAVSWIALYWLNTQFDPWFKEHPGVSWVFLPAGLRLLLVLVCGWRAVIGLMLGGLVTGTWMLPDHAWLVPVFSVVHAIAPMLAALTARRFFGIWPDLGNLTPLKLTALCLLFALFNVVLQQGMYLAAGVNALQALPGLVMAMMFGDVTGSLIVLLAASWSLRLYGYRRRWD